METMQPERSATAGADLSPREVWEQVTARVRREVDVPTVWLAMQAARPLAIEGHHFIAGLAERDQYLATNLLSHEYSVAVEEALQHVTGRVLAFRLIEGETLDDWHRERDRDAATQAAPRPQAQPTPPPSAPQAQAPPPQAPPSAARPQSGTAPTTREVYPTWEALNHHLAHGYKTAPLIKYSHGQARYLLECVQAISDTMDVLVPPASQGHDEAQERQLAKTVERLGGIINLDPLFISLELMRFRLYAGKDIGLSG